MDDVERDGDITINVGFGNITFYRDEAGPYACTVAEFTIRTSQADKRETTVELTMRFDCAPDSDTVLDVVEKSRQQAICLLRSAANHLDEQTAQSLTYREEAS